jgi:hypothetical protein
MARVRSLSARTAPLRALPSSRGLLRRSRKSPHWSQPPALAAQVPSSFLSLGWLLPRPFARLFGSQLLGDYGPVAQ